MNDKTRSRILVKAIHIEMYARKIRTQLDKKKPDCQKIMNDAAEIFIDGQGIYDEILWNDEDD